MEQGYPQYEPEVLKRLQAAELDLLKEFVRICDKHDIDYFAVFGTTIGVVRHQGFIPWDDDMDFGMLRKDYEKLLEVAPQELGDTYAISGPDCEKRFYNLLSKFYNKKTIFHTVYNGGDFEMGINLDLFVFDNLAEDERLRTKQIKRAELLRRIYMTKNVNFFSRCVFKKGKLLQRLASGALHYLWKIVPLSNDAICRMWKENATQYEGQTSVVTQFNDTGIWESRISMDDLYPLKELPFEDIKIKVPNNYDKILREMYGDYLALPPFEKRQNHYPYLLQFEGEDKQYGTSV